MMIMDRSEMMTHYHRYSFSQKDGMIDLRVSSYIVDRYQLSQRQ